MNHSTEEEVIHNHPGADKPHTHDAHQHRPEDTAESIQLREEQLQPRTEQVTTGRVRLGKEIVEEQRTLEVPVAHDEVTIDRHPVNRRPSDTAIGDNEHERIQVPVTEEQVSLDKRAVVTEEVGINKRAVQDTQHVSGTVRREEARVETDGEAHPHYEA